MATHRISTGRRSGQLLLLRLTALGAQELGDAGLGVDVLDGNDFLRRFYVHQLAEFATRTWPGATIPSDRAPDAARDFRDLTVLIPGADGSVPSSAVAFRIVMDGDADMSALARDLDQFDEVYLWAESPQAAAALQRNADEHLQASASARVTCAPITFSLSVSSPDPAETPPARKRSGARRSRQGTLLNRQFVQAYEHVHDLDWLHESPLIKLEAVRARANQLSPMPEAQALRDLLVEAAKRAARHASEVPTQVPLRVFLESYLEGKQIKEIAAALGVSREWCSRAYRKQALELAARQCERLVAVGDQRSSK